jgi:hypothetical protein
LPPLLLPVAAWAYERWTQRPDARLAVKPVFSTSGLSATSSTHDF